MTDLMFRSSKHSAWPTPAGSDTTAQQVIPKKTSTSSVFRRNAQLKQRHDVNARQVLEQDSVVEAVADQKKFFDNAIAYGYTPTEVQRTAIARLSAGKNVILRVVSGDTPLEDSQVVHHTSNSKGGSKTLQASGGEIPDESLGGGYMPGKIATYSLGILNRVDLSGPEKCQCVISVFDGGYVDEVIEDMKQLGEGRVKVARLSHRFTENSSLPHVAVGGAQHILGLLLDQPFLFCHVKMVVFDWGYTSYYTKHAKMLRRIYMLMRQRSSSNKLQFALFSETEVPRDFKIMQKIEILDYPAFRKYTLGGIKKHMFINVQVDDEDSLEFEVEARVNAIVDLIKKLESGKRNRIVIVVNRTEEFERLTRKLSGLCVLISLSKGMTQEDRNREVGKFLCGKSVLITRRVWFRDMPPEFFASEVRRIIYSDCRETDYMQTMGWFHHVGAVITILKDSEFDNLLVIQKLQSVKFQRTEPSKFGRAKLEGRKLNVFIVGSDKINHMRFLDEIVIATGNGSTTSIIFVKEATLVDGLVTKLKDIFEDAQNLVITKSIDEAAKAMKKERHSCIFFTCDCVAKIDEIKNDVRVLVIYDTPIQKDDYDHLFALGNEHMVVIHLVNDSDCSELFDIQVNLGVTLEPFIPGFVIDDLEQFFPSIYPPSKDDDDAKESGKKRK